MLSITSNSYTIHNGKGINYDLEPSTISHKDFRSKESLKVLAGGRGMKIRQEALLIYTLRGRELAYGFAQVSSDRSKQVGTIKLCTFQMLRQKILLPINITTPKDKNSL